MENLTLGAKKLGIELNPRQLEQFSIYYRELVEWNQRINLTAITDYEEVQIKHFLDSLTLTLVLKQSTDSCIYCDTTFFNQLVSQNKQNISVLNNKNRYIDFSGIRKIA